MLRLRFGNWTFVLRLLNVFLSVWLLAELPSLLDQLWQWRRYLGHNDRGQGQAGGSLAGGALDEAILTVPPPAGSLRREVIRLNELFARPTHKCAQRRVVGTRKDGAAFVCFDREGMAGTDKIGRALLVTGSTENTHNDFELALNVSRWTVVLPQQTDLVDRLQGDVLVQYMPELRSYAHFPRDRIANALQAQHFHLAKLDLHSSRLSQSQRETNSTIALIEWILARIQTQQLVLVIRPGADPMAVGERQSGQVLLRWYRFMFGLFFTWKYALLGVHSNGRCGQALQPFDARHCEWRVSLVRFEDLWTVHDLPAFGVGSPLEEKLRFRRYLLSGSALLAEGDCSALDEDLPGICGADQLSEEGFHLFAYFRQRPFGRGQLRRLAEMTERLALFHPGEISEVPANVQHIAAGVSPGSNPMRVPVKLDSTVQSASLPLRPIDFLLNSTAVRPFQRNVLLLDLDGAEWDVFGALSGKTTCDKWLRSFAQVAIRLRLWAMEEADNWRRHLLWLLRLEECRFGKAFAKQNDPSTILLTFRRAKIVI